MSFEAVWGFDPERVLQAQNLLQNEFVLKAGKDQVEMGDGVQEVKIPESVDAQLYELRRMFRA